MHWDFDRLYRALGLGPGCDLATLQQAYRRRLSALHPDKGGVPGEASLELHELQALYKRALAFHADYGRLPGTSPVSRGDDASAPGASIAEESEDDATPVAAARGMVHLPVPAPPPQASPSRWPWLLIAVVLVAIALVAWSAQREPVAVATPTWSGHIGVAGDVAPVPGRALQAMPRQALHAGMRAARARRLLGMPTMEDGHYWWYGPSWVRIEGDHVDSWYSSPLRPLHIATTADDDVAPPQSAYDPAATDPALRDTDAARD